MLNLNGIGRKRCCLTGTISSHLPGGVDKNHSNTSVKIGCVVTESRSEHLPTANLERCHYANPLDMLIQFLGMTRSTNRLVTLRTFRISCPRDDSCSVVPMLRAADREIQVRFLAGARKLFLVNHQIGHGIHLLEIKWPECGADYSPPALEISGTISPLPHTPRWYRAKHSMARFYLHLTPSG